MAGPALSQEEEEWSASGWIMDTTCLMLEPTPEPKCFSRMGNWVDCQRMLILHRKGLSSSFIVMNKKLYVVERIACCAVVFLLICICSHRHEGDSQMHTFSSNIKFILLKVHTCTITLFLRLTCTHRCLKESHRKAFVSRWKASHPQPTCRVSSDTFPWQSVL